MWWARGLPGRGRDRGVCQLSEATSPRFFWNFVSNFDMGVHTQGQVGGQLTPWKNGWKLKKRKYAKKSSFLCLCYILRAIMAGMCRERRYADHIFIQMYFRIHHFAVKFSKKNVRRQGGIDPPNQNPAGVPVPIQLAQCWFSRLAISNADRRLYFPNKNTRKQFYQTALGNCYGSKLPKCWLQFYKNCSLL